MENTETISDKITKPTENVDMVSDEYDSDCKENEQVCLFMKCLINFALWFRVTLFMKLIRKHPFYKFRFPFRFNL